MKADSTLQAERLNALLKALNVPGQYSVVVSAGGRLLFRKKGLPISRETVALALRKVGIVALHSLADNLVAYKNNYTELKRPDGSVLRKGEIVLFHQFRSEVQGFRQLRGSVAVLLSFSDFFIEVDPKKLTPTSLVRSGASSVVPDNDPVQTENPVAPSDDCEETRRENMLLREELQSCRAEVERCQEENTFFREEYKELPEDIVEELPETQVETVTQEIIETVSEIKNSFDTGHAKEAEKQQKHLHELVNELHEKASTTTVKATEDCIVLENKQLGGIEVKFPRKPAPETIHAIKTQGFRWNGKRKVWYAKKTEKRMEFAKQLCPDQSIPVAHSDTARTIVAPPKTLHVFTHKLYGGEASKKIKSKLREIFPGIKFSVTFDGYAGGSSINIRTSNISETDQKRIEDVVSRFGGKTWQSDGWGGDSISTYLKGAPFVEKGELHQYTVSSSLGVQVDDYSDTDKTSPEYIHHFAEVYTDTSSALVMERPIEPERDYRSHKETGERSHKETGEPKVIHSTPDEQILFENGMYIYQFFDLSLAVKQIRAKLEEIFPRVHFHVSASDEYVRITAKDISTTDAIRIRHIIGHFGHLTTEGSEDEELFYPGTPFLEKGEKRRYDIINFIYFHVEGTTSTDKTSPDYIHHSSQEDLMAEPFIVDTYSEDSPFLVPTEPPAEEDFFPPPSPEEQRRHKPQPETEPRQKPEPVHTPEPSPEVEPAQPEAPKTDVGAQISALREALMAALNKKQGGA